MLFEFVWEADFEYSLKQIEVCPYCADRLMRRIEYRCSLQVSKGSQGYGFVRFSWRFQKLVTWYLATNPVITILDIKRDFGVHYSKHRNAA